MRKTFTENNFFKAASHPIVHSIHPRIRKRLSLRACAYSNQNGYHTESSVRMRTLIFFLVFAEFLKETIFYINVHLNIALTLSLVRGVTFTNRVGISTIFDYIRQSILLYHKRNGSHVTGNRASFY